MADPVAKIRRADFYADDWLAGTFQLTLEEKGGSITVCALIYSTADRLHDDDRYIAGACRADLRVWKRIKQRLIDLGKIAVEDGFVRNKRCTSEILRGLRRVVSAREAGRAGGLKSASGRSENNDLLEPAAQAVAQASKQHSSHQPPTTKESSAAASSPDPVADARQDAAALAQSIPWEEVGRKACELCGLDPRRLKADSMAIIKWLQVGANADRHIYPTIRAVTARQRLTSSAWLPRSLAYFSDAIREAANANAAPNPDIMRNNGRARHGRANGLRRATVEDRENLVEAESVKRGHQLRGSERRQFLIEHGIDPDAE